MVAAPKKPFPGYAWHWASVQPTEGLLIPPVFFGVLRALRKHEGEKKSSAHLRAALLQVENDTVGIRPARLKLARAADRNLIRNSGQVWQSLGLLKQRSSTVELTPLGRKVADGVIPVDDFIAAVVRQLELPNPNNDSQAVVNEWNTAGLKIHPLRLLLEILLDLPENPPGITHLTSAELTDVIIPLAGERATVRTHVQAITELRSGKLDLTAWPNCTPGTNDPRSAREFLIFLARNGFLTIGTGPSNRGKFLMEPAQRALAEYVLSRSASEQTLEAAAQEAEDDGLSIQVARTRRLVEQIHRPNQAKFKRTLVNDHGERCAVTGETTPAVLIAAHIIPVKYNGDDSSANGLLLRADIHTLLDAGLINIHPDGKLDKHASLDGTFSYHALPSKIKLAACVKEKNLKWRLDYL